MRLAFGVISPVRRGINLSDIKVDFHKMASKEVVNFMSLTLDGKQVGQQILKAPVKLSRRP